MNNVRIQRAALSNAVQLCENIRPRDAEEVLAVGGVLDPEQLWSRLSCSDEVFAAVTYEGELICLFGVGPFPAQTEVGIPWLLGTPLLDKNAVTLCRWAPYWLRRWQRKYPVLTNFTSRTNRRVLSWLKWLGAEFVREIEVGSNSMPFVQFVFK